VVKKLKKPNVLPLKVPVKSTIHQLAQDYLILVTNGCQWAYSRIEGFKFDGDVIVSILEIIHEEELQADGTTNGIALWTKGNQGVVIPAGKVYFFSTLEHAKQLAARWWRSQKRGENIPQDKFVNAPAYEYFQCFYVNGGTEESASAAAIAAGARP